MLGFGNLMVITYRVQMLQLIQLYPHPQREYICQ